MAIRGPLTPALAEDLGAIPGVPVDVKGMSWALRMGPDRAESVQAGVDAPRPGDERRRAHRHRGALRPARPVRPGRGGLGREGMWLSLMEDWLSLALEELRAVPGQPGAARGGQDRGPADPLDRGADPQHAELPLAAAQPRGGAAR